MRLIIASNNAHKVREIKDILSPYYDEILSMRDAGIEAEVVEDGETFIQNAVKKAEEIFALAGADAVLSDDSGLMVDALGGAPGVYSARFSGEGHNDAANNAKLLHEMSGVPEENRGCRFVCAVALARRGKATLTAEGYVEGRLLEAQRGSSGFGYDPLFYYEPFNKSFAELTAEEKNSVSHRARAIIALRDKLKEESQCC